MTLIHGDATSIPLADNSVDLVVTSPPYWALRSYTDDGEHYAGQIGSEDTSREFLDALWATTAELARVLKPTGSLFVNLGDKYAGSGGHNNSAISSKSTLRGNGHVGGGPKYTDGRPCGLAGRQAHDRPVSGGGARNASRRNAPDHYNQARDVRAKSLMGLPWLYANGCTGALAAIGGPDPGLNLILRAEIVWDKPNGLPESVTDRVRRSHEQWFHLTGEGDYYAAVDELREPHTGNAHPARTDGEAPPGGKQERQVATGQRGGTTDATNLALFNPMGKLPGSVWSIPSEPLKVPIGFASEDRIAWAAMGDPVPWFSSGAELQRRHLWERAELLAAQQRPLFVSQVDHFAAFPQEWPRRLIMGWSPPGICLECGAGRRPDLEIDWEQVPHSLVPKRMLTRADTLSFTAELARWCDVHAVTSADLNEATGTSMAGHWLSQASQPEVPTPAQWAVIAAAFGPMPTELDAVVHSTTLVPVADFTIGVGDKSVSGWHRNVEQGNRPDGYRGIVGYRCDCDQPTAPTRPAVVLDPFGGTGTVAMVARALGRQAVHLDLSADYLRLARWRVHQSGHAAKSIARMHRERQGVLL